MFQLRLGILNQYLFHFHLILLGKLSFHFIIDINELFKFPRIDRLDFEEKGWQFIGLGFSISIARIVKKTDLMLKNLIATIPDLAEVEQKTIEAIHEKYGEAISATKKMIEMNSAKGEREATITFHMLGEEKIVLEALSELLVKTGYQVYRRHRGLRILW